MAPRRLPDFPTKIPTHAEDFGRGKSGTRRGHICDKAPVVNYEVDKQAALLQAITQRSYLEE